MNDSLKKTKPTLDSLLEDSQLQTGRDLIKRIKAQELELEVFKQSVEFEERNRKNKRI